MNLATAFVQAARQHSDKTAVFWGDQQISYLALLQETERLAGILRGEFGVTPGDRVALWMKNCPEFIPAYFSVHFNGAVVVTINNFLKPAEVQFILDDAGADVVITDASLDEAAAKLAGLRPQTRFLGVEEFGSQTGGTPESTFTPQRSGLGGSFRRC